MSSQLLASHARARRFFFHYSRPATLAAGETRMSVHMGKTCHLARRVVCEVPVETKENTSQPLLVLRGMARNIERQNDTIYIRN